MKKLFLLLCTLLATVGAWATEITTQKTTLITSELAIESGKYYAFRVNGGSFITESEGQYVAPNAQNSITDAALYTLTSTDGGWKVCNKSTSAFWGTLSGAALGTFNAAGGPDAGVWTLTFSGNNVQASSGGFFINRSSGVMHGWGSGINLQMYLVEDVTLTIATTLDEINPNKAYSITNSRGSWSAAADGSKIQGVGLDLANANQHFALVNYDEKLYIYNLGTKKFLGYDDTKGRDNSVLGAPTPITIAETADANYHWFFNFDESHNVNLSGGIIIIDGWTAHDAGNMNMLIEAADFDSSEAIKAIMAANAQPGDDLTAFIVNPSFETGDMTGWTCPASSDTGVKPNSNGTYTTNGCDGQYLFNTWWKGNPITQTITGLPNGKYELKVLVANDAGESNADKPCIYLLANGEHAGPVAGTSKGTFAEGSIEFLVTNGTATIGVVGGNTDGSFREDGYYWYKCDNFRLTYLEALPSIDDVEIPEGKMSLAAEEGIEAAKASGDVIQLLDAVAVAKKSIEAYAKAADAIAAAKEILNSTNVPTEEATQGFAGAIEIFEDGYEAGNLSDEEAANAAATLGTAVTEWREGANGESVKFLESAFDLPNGNFNVPLYVNTWSVEGENDGSNFKVPFYENFTGDDQSLAVNRFQTTVEGLTPGDMYEVSALIRTQLNKAASEQSETPYGISFGAEGGEPVDACADAELFSANKLYLKEVTAVGTVDDEGVLTIYVEVSEGNNVHWLSFKNIKYKKIVPTVCVGVENGNFIESSGNFVYQWTSNETVTPTVDITIPGKVNNFDKRVTEGNFMMYSGRVLSSPYDFTLPMGYAIKSVTIKAKAASGVQTVTCEDQTQEFGAEAELEFTMEDPDGSDNTFEFVLTGSNTGLAVSSICIEYEEVGIASVRYLVEKDGSPLAEELKEYNVGTHLTEFAPDILRPFVEYEFDEAPQLTEAADYTWKATVSKLGGVYQIMCDDKFVFGYQLEDIIYVSNWGLTEGKTGEEDEYLWTVTGDPYETVQISNNMGGNLFVGSDGYAQVSADAAPVEVSGYGPNASFKMYANGNQGFYPFSTFFYVGDGTNVYPSGDFTAVKVADLPAEEVVLEGIAALKNFEMPEGAESADVTLRLADAKVTFVNTVEQTDIDWDTFEEITITKDNVVMEDASAATLLQGLGLNEALKAGDTVTGDIRFTVVSGMFGNEYVANDFTAESLTALEITEGEATPLAVTDDNVEAYAENYDYYYVEFADATYSISEDGEATINLPVMGESFAVLDALQALTDDAYPEEGTPVTARGYIVDYFGLVTYFQPISFEVEEQVVPVQITGTFDGMIKQILSHPLTGKQGEAKGEQTVTIAEGEEEGTYDITFSGFTMPVTGAVLPEFTVTGVEAEVSEDGGTATYSLPVWAPQTITIDRGTGSVTYDVKLEGTKSGEDAPVLKLTLTNSVVDDVYFGADEETIDAAIEADEATAISGINSINEAGTVFDLSGRKVEKVQRGGIYIVNGKKVSIK